MLDFFSSEARKPVDNVVIQLTFGTLEMQRGQDSMTKMSDVTHCNAEKGSGWIVFHIGFKAD